MSKSETQSGRTASTRFRRASARILKPVLWIIVLGFAVHVIFPQLSHLGDSFAALRSGRWPFLIVSAFGSVVTFTAAAWMVRASTTVDAPWGRTIAVQLAASAAATLTPAGLGWIAINRSYLRKRGADDAEAVAATGLNMALTVVGHVILVAVLLPFLPALRFSASAFRSRTVMEIVVVVLLALGVAAWIPASRRRILAEVLPVLRAVPTVVSNRSRTLQMIGGAMAENIGFGISLIGAVAAFGAHPSIVGVEVVYLLSAVVGSVAPTPGGLGAVEAALVAGITRLGVGAGQAVAGVLAFRVITFWLMLPLGAAALRIARREGWV